MKNFYDALMEDLTAEEVLEISKRLNVDYSYTTEAEERRCLGDDICEMLEMLENAGFCMDYLDAPYTNGIETTYKTAFEKAMNIIDDFMELVMNIQNFKGDGYMPENYKTHADYIYDRAFGTEYILEWVNGCSDCPYLDEIRDMCDQVAEMIAMWDRAVENGWIDPEEGWERDFYWAYEADNQKWILWSHTEDDEVQIAEVGQDEDGTYYWVDDNGKGDYGFATAEKAMSDADYYIG